jgi:hypothetical protein
MKANLNNFLQNCKSKDIICFQVNQLYKIHQLQDLFEEFFNNYLIQEIRKIVLEKYKIDSINFLLKDGAKCEILKAGSPGWQKENLKLT